MKRILHLLGLAALLASLAFATSVRIEMLPDSLGVRMQTVGFGLSSDAWENDEPSVTIRALQNGTTPLAVTTPPSGVAVIDDKLKTIAGRIVFDGNFTIDFSVSSNEDPFVSLANTCTNASTSPIACVFSISSPVAPDIYNNSSLSFGVTLTGPASGAFAPYTATGIQANGYLGNPAYVLDLTTPLVPSSIAVGNGQSTTTSSNISHTFANRTDITTMEASFNVLVPRRGGTGTNTSVATTGIYVLNPIPEPGTFVMMGLGLLGVAFAVRRRVN